MSDIRPVCVIAGAGPGNGLAFGRRFTDANYSVALLSRSVDNLEQLQGSLPEAHTFQCDVGSSADVTATFASIRDALGPVSTLIYNAGSGVFGSIDDLDNDQFEQAWRTNTLGCFHCVKAVLPDMRAHKSGNIAIIGATASKRGGARFTAFTSAKAAQYNLAQSLARHLGPESIHVSYYIIDGSIDIPRTRKRMPDKADDFFLNPNHIADTLYNVTQQPTSAWTFEIDLRPYAETW